MMTVEPGDTLLLVGHPSFVTRFNESEVFGLIRNLGETTAFRPVNIPKMAIGLALGITMIALTSAEVLPLLSAAMATGILAFLPLLFLHHFIPSLKTDWLP